MPPTTPCVTPNRFLAVGSTSGAATVGARKWAAVLLLGGLLVGGLGGTLGGCQAITAEASSAQAVPVTVGALEIDRDAFDLELEPPELLRDRGAMVKPLQGEALQAASLSFEQVLEELDTPDYISEAASAAEAEPREEPAAAAIRAYTLGRLAYHDGERLQAINKLEEAHQLDPESAHILRVLGRMHFAFGNEVRGAQRLEEAVRLDGSDAESLFLLGRFAAQNGRWPEAIVALARSEELTEGEVDPALAYLRPFYMGQALFEMQYDAAAVQQLQQYLTLPQRMSRVTRLHRELAFMDRQRARTHVQIGDALTRLGRLDEGLAQYEKAAEDEDADDVMLTARRVYALVAMGHERSAQQLLIEGVGDAASAEQTLTLVGYVAQDEAGKAAFAERLERVYHEADRPAHLAMAMADLLEPAEAMKLLAKHLEHRPEHVAVFERLLATLGEADAKRAVATVVQLMQANPGRADAYAEALLTHYEEPVLLSELDRLSATASGLYLRGKLYEIDGRTEEAIAEYEQALELDPAFAASHLALVELQIQLERYEQALSLLDEMGEVGDRRSRLARARIYAGLERVEDAVEVLESLIEDHASRAEPRLLLAEMQVRQREFDAAAETLWTALELEPENERAYELLFDVHDENPRTQASERLRLLRQVQQEIPESRIARLRMVTHWHLPRAEFDEAEQVLRTLLEDDQQDYEALSRLVGILGHTDRWAEAQDLLVEHIEAGAEDEEADVVPLLLLEEVVKHTDDTALFYREMERFLDRQEPSAETYVQLARLYESDHLDRPDKAVEVLRKAVALEPEFVDELRLYLVQLLYRLERTDEALAELTKAIEGNPDQAPDLYAFKATIHHDVGQIAEAERMLKAALEIDPAHAGANNDLAYYWAEQDRNLEQALGMARTAIGAEPDNGAYLDTAGWIYYKLGRFEQAVMHLRRARATPMGEDPTILDHLGDALWRTGSEAEAVRQWQAAERMATRMIEQGVRRRDVREIREAARVKIDAAGDADRNPPVARLADEAEAEADGDAESVEEAEPPDGP